METGKRKAVLFLYREISDRLVNNAVAAEACSDLQCMEKIDGFCSCCIVEQTCDNVHHGRQFMHSMMGNVGTFFPLIWKLTIAVITA